MTLSELIDLDVSRFGNGQLHCYAIDVAGQAIRPYVEANVDLDDTVFEVVYDTVREALDVVNRPERENIAELITTDVYQRKLDEAISNLFK